MFERLKQRKPEARSNPTENRPERDQQEALVKALCNIIDSGTGRGRDYWGQLASYSGKNLTLLLDTFGNDPQGLTGILLESVGSKEAEAFVRERIRYPFSLDTASLGTEKAYRVARECLDVPDMSVFPAGKDNGVRAILTVSAFCVIRHLDGDEGPIEPQLASLLMEMPDRVDDIIDYLKERKAPLKKVNVPHLHEVLVTDIKSLSSGVL